MAWCIWCGTVPHVRDGDLNSMIEARAKNNWLLHCRTAQILCVSQHVIWVYKMPVVQSTLLLCSGKLSFLLAGSCVCVTTAWVQLERKHPSSECILLILQMGGTFSAGSFPSPSPPFPPPSLSPTLPSLFPSFCWAQCKAVLPLLTLTLSSSSSSVSLLLRILPEALVRHPEPHATPLWIRLSKLGKE